jgi:UDP-N-acetylglucosamine 2-epimerase
LRWFPTAERCRRRAAFFLSVGKPFPAISIRTSTERPEALDAGCFILAGIDAESLLQAVEMAVGMQRDSLLRYAGGGLYR